MNKKILIVDDDPTVRAWATKVLKQAQWEPYEVDSGEKALDFLNNETIDVMLLDLNMPGISGVTVMKQAKQHWPEVATIIMTAEATVDSAIEAVKYGAFCYLKKPCSPQEILDEAHLAWLEKRKKYQLPTIKQTDEHLIIIGPLEINPWQRTVRKAGVEINLAPAVYRLLLTLAKTPGETVPIDALIQGTLEHQTVDDTARDNIRVYVARLRKSIGAEYIQNIRSVGYKLALPPEKK